MVVKMLAPCDITSPMASGGMEKESAASATGGRTEATGTGQVIRDPRFGIRFWNDRVPFSNLEFRISNLESRI
jgi:hypothetical protein